MTTNNEIFGRITDDGDIAVLYVEDGVAVTSLDENIYPVGSELSVRYEHPEGIVISVADAESIGLKIEHDPAALTAAVADSLVAAPDFFLGGEDVAVVAAEWCATGLPLATIRAYMKARCFDAESAKKLDYEGITPARSGRKIDVFGYRDTIGYAVSNGDLDMARAVAVALPR